MEDSCGSSTTSSTGILSDHPTFDGASLVLGLARGLPCAGLFRRDLQGLERGKRVVLGIGGFNQRFKNRIRLAGIGIDAEIECIGGKPAEIDDAVLDRLRWIGRLLAARPVVFL